MAALDAFASSPWYIDHLRPVWLALPPEARGRLYVSAKSIDAAKGLPGVTLSPPVGRGPILTLSYADYRAAVMIGRLHIALGQHGAGQSYSNDGPAYPGGRGQERASLFLVPNEHSAQRSRRAYPRAQVEIIGCPKLDTLPRKERDGEPVIAFSFHWDSRTIPELRSAWSYYQRAVLDVARHHKVIGHAHPRTLSMIGRWYRKVGIETVASFEDVLRRADVYCCDNSVRLVRVRRDRTSGGRAERAHRTDATCRMASGSGTRLGSGSTSTTRASCCRRWIGPSRIRRRSERSGSGRSISSISHGRVVRRSPQPCWRSGPRLALTR